MQQLQNGNAISNISVYPKNWDKKGASIENDWYAHYRFYSNGKVKRIVLKKNINRLRTLGERQQYMRMLIKEEMNYLINNNYNPISKVAKVIEVSSIVTPETEFLSALKFAQNNITLESNTAQDLRSVMNYLSEGLQDLRISNLPIGEVRKRHIRLLFDHLTKKRKWSNNTYNHYRSMLMILFKELGEYDAVESNIPRELSKKKTTRKARLVLNESQRKEVKRILKEENPRFWLFVNMFFHSGARETEFCRLQLKDVNLENQTVKFLIKKGRSFKEAIKPIKNIALPYWEQYLKGYDDKELFIIGKGLFPQLGKGLRPEQITRRWRKFIKTNPSLEIPIEADFYSLKHLNTDEISSSLTLEDAALLNSHDNLSTTKIYAINEKAREMEKIKKVANEF